MARFEKKTINKKNVVIEYATLIITVISLVSAFSTFRDFFDNPKYMKRLILGDSINVNRAEITKLKNEIQNLKVSVNRNDTITLKNPLSREIYILNKRIDNLEIRFTKIEKVIIKSPNEVLEIPLLKRDIDAINISNEYKLNNLSEDIERAYNIILVSLTSLAIAVFAPLLTSLFQKRNRNQPTEQTE